MVGRHHTSTCHLIVKLALFGVWGSSIVVAAFIAEWITPLIGLQTEYAIVPWLVLLVIVTLVFAYLENRYDASLDAIAAFLYLRVELGTQVSFKEAKELSFLFLANENGKWYALSVVRKLPKEKRRQYVFEAAEHVKEKGVAL